MTWHGMAQHGVATSSASLLSSSTSPLAWRLETRRSEGKRELGKHEAHTTIGTAVVAVKLDSSRQVTYQKWKHAECRRRPKY
mmetsp:Transcript_66614/g.139065  ORF Transcript_66614/g.139065 Transcript_66614/m.139065 type:complete len:82 (-) Transcript_66614:506-751(-)|eukprot:CAMPEP_0206486796 /NCGR_PEP_ID=MMETSP0324_2-20121206/41242_1 /ASSEMBLY_ACC=CAM_ASM_000836 /TAXON_ID=2866 /ORGANISM="Crypthecodinium cohnii, Strain Seligo" /LENGTH=81 /DNA_ID=CAMNT_0053965121 /DNA_START=314 /DNA_END=559 /DNA_ORIENTATION=+